MIVPVILAGGSGTRLWPLSRQSYPKQFLHLVDEKYTMLQLQRTMSNLLCIIKENTVHKII